MCGGVCLRDSTVHKINNRNHDSIGVEILKLK